MANKKKLKTDTQPARDTVIPEDGTNAPLIFISHDSRDADLAEAIAMLLTDASGGILKSFRSSDKSGNTGIDFGTEWYQAIMQKLDEATDVVALLTERSLDRPWILYETGVAKGKLDRVVLGLALGIPLEKAATGPFAQFQNSADDEDSITKLVLQLIRRHPDANPREQAVRRQVQAFREQIADLMKARQSQPPSEKSEPADASVAKLFEEIKLQIRDLPEIAKTVSRISAVLMAKPVAALGTPPVRTAPVPLRPIHLDVAVDGKTYRINLANSWVMPLRQLGWPEETPQVQEFISEITNWFTQDPSRIKVKGSIALSHGSGQVNPQPNGVMLNNFKKGPPPAAR